MVRERESDGGDDGWMGGEKRREVRKVVGSDDDGDYEVAMKAELMG